MTVEPGDDLLVSGTRSEQLLDFIGLDALELEEHLIKRAGVMIFANGALNIGTSFIDHACHQRVAAETSRGLRGGRFVKSLAVFVVLISLLCRLVSPQIHAFLDRH